MSFNYVIIEEFNRFWELFAVDETLFPHRRACCLRLWHEMPEEKRKAIIDHLRRHGAPKNRNPFFYLQDFGQARTQTLSYAEYYTRYHTTEPRDGWQMANPTGQKVVYVKVL